MEKKNFNQGQKKEFKGVKKFGSGKPNARKFGEKKPKGPNKNNDNLEDKNDQSIVEKKEEVSFKKKRYTKEEIELMKNKYQEKYNSLKKDPTPNLSNYDEISNGVTMLGYNMECLPDVNGKIPPMLKKGQCVTYKVFRSKFSDHVSVIMTSMDGRKAFATQKLLQ